MPFEVFPKERHVGEIEGVGDVLDGDVGGLKLCFGVHDDHRGYDFEAGLACYLSNRSAQVGLRYA